MEDIFGEENHLGTIAIRINPGGRKSKRKVHPDNTNMPYFFRGHHQQKLPKFL